MLATSCSGPFQNGLANFKLDQPVAKDFKFGRNTYTHTHTHTHAHTHTHTIMLSAGFSIQAIIKLLAIAKTKSSYILCTLAKTNIVSYVATAWVEKPVVNMNV